MDDCEYKRCDLHGFVMPADEQAGSNQLAVKPGILETIATVSLLGQSMFIVDEHSDRHQLAPEN
jgi:hypothetical protein